MLDKYFESYSAAELHCMDLLKGITLPKTERPKRRSFKKIGWDD